MNLPDGVVGAALLTAPWTLALIVALLRGYDVHVTRRPPGRHERTDDDDQGPS